MTVNYNQAGETHCFGCHKDFAAGINHFCDGIALPYKPCSASCSRWFKGVKDYKFCYHCGKEL